MDENPVLKASLTTARVLSVLFPSVLLVYAQILYVSLPRFGYTTIYPPGDPLINVITVTLGVMSVLNITLGFLLPRWILKRYSDKARGLLTTHIMTSAFFEAVGIYGLILGLLGAGAQVSGLFLLASAIPLILTFPRSEKWKRIVEDS